jgi:hypothetical protein
MSWMRHPTAELLLLSALCAAGPAHAVADVSKLRFQVSVQRLENAIQGTGPIQTEVRLQGTGIARATMTPPGGTAIPLVADGADFVLSRPATSEQQLDSLLPQGSYLFALNDGAASIAVSYTRPSVPSPAISEPLPLSLLPPGSVTVRFTPCATCLEEDDVVAASIEDDLGEIDSVTFENVAGEEPSIPDVSEWSPTGLPENSKLLARVVHTVLRNIPLETDRNDPFDFENVFGHGDSVPFFTAFSPPDGHFCIVANDDGPLEDGCVERSEPEAGLLDPSGADTIEVAGLTIFYLMTVGLDGSITGTAVTDLDGNGNQESVGLFGKLRGLHGRANQSFKIGFDVPALGTKLRIKLKERFSIPHDTRSRLQSARGVLAGQKVRERETSESSLTPEPLGWLLDFELTGERDVTGASLALTGREPIPLTGRWNFDPELDTSALTLLSEDEAVRVRIEELVIDGPEIVSGKIRVKAFGQKARLVLR